MSLIISKIKKAHKAGRLIPALKSRINLYAQGFKYIIHDPASDNVVLHSPDYLEPSKDKSEIEVVERIFQSFKKMKNDQQKVSELYLPSSLWQQHIDVNYSYFTDALQSNDIDKFHFFLSNFGSWKQNHGIESNMLIRDNMKTLIGRRYLKNVIFYKNLKNWQWFYNSRKPVSCLTYPTHGNQSGAYIEDTFVGVGSFFNEIYGSILNGLLDDIERPVVADLGAGYGKLAYFILRDMKDSCFIDFDLPETLCLAAYYLMKSWPEKRTLLYGEQEYSEKSHNNYDLIFMPSYEIENVGNNSIDLFMNKNSLGEMTRDAATNYIHHVANTTRYFFHMNHDNFPNVYSDNSPGPLGYEYPVPKDKFKLLFRYPDVGHMLYQGKLDYDMDIFLYLYERRS
jgi:hypothetical protein